MTLVRTALAAQIGRLAVPALRSLPQPEDQINPPVGIVMPGRPYLTYGTTLQGETGFLGEPSAAGSQLASVDFNLDYLIIVSHASTLERIEVNLDAWLGFEDDASIVSVPAAVAADPTLGGVVDWCIPITADPPGPLSWSGPEAFGTRIHFNFSA
jgi:hypothetical protein